MSSNHILADGDRCDSDLSRYACWQVRESSQLNHPDITGESQKELLRLQEDQQRLQEQLEVCFFVVVIIILLFTVLLKIGGVWKL